MIAGGRHTLVRRRRLYALTPAGWRRHSRPHAVRVVWRSETLPGLSMRWGVYR